MRRTENIRHRYVAPRMLILDTCKDGYCDSIFIGVSPGKEDTGDGRDVKEYDMEWDEPTVTSQPYNVWDKVW